MQFSLGFSPCPNDTFMFDALVNGKLGKSEYSFIPHIADVEALNRMCLNGELDISKMSYYTYTQLSDQYQMLTSGSALGRGVGPLLISKMPYNLHDVDRLKIAIPGANTTAAFLLQLAFPEASNLIETSFEEIEGMVMKDEVDAGVIIHENRFTYADKGLLKLIDLGAFWEEKTRLPIPLGGIAVKRSLSDEVKQGINELVANSVKFAFDQPTSSAEYVRSYAQEMDSEVLKKHISTYVNQYSVDLENEGKAAVYRMFKEKYPQNRMEIEKNFLFVN